MKKLYLSYLLRLLIFIGLIVYFFITKSDGDDLLPFSLVRGIILAGFIYCIDFIGSGSGVKLI